MFQYSFSSVYMAVITGNILLILIAILFRNHKIMIHTGYKLLALFIALAILRFALPFELPFTTTVLLTDFKAISLFIVCLRHSLFTIGDIQISIWIIFELVWLVGVIIVFYQYLRLRRKTRYYILSNSLDCTAEEPYHSLVTNEDSALLQRYHMLISADRKKNILLNILLFLLIIGIYAFSHRYTFEANYTTPEVAENTMEATADSVYAIQNDDGTYDVYFMGYYTETTDSLEYYPSDIPVYTGEEISDEN